MTGAIINAAGIVAGGVVGLLPRIAPRLTAQSQQFLKLLLGVLTIFFGLRLVWMSVNGTFLQIMKQFAIAALALVFGRLLGRLLRLQKASNRLGQYARQLIEQNKPGDPLRLSNGMNACAVLFCAAPLGILGAIQDGLPIYPDGSGYFYPLAVKAAMDGLAMMGFVTMFGWGAILSALPVFVFQAAITLACNIYAAPFLQAHGLLFSVDLIGGLLVCTIGLVIFEFKKVELADYLPSLAFAPLITWLWK